MKRGWNNAYLARETLANVRANVFRNVVVGAAAFLALNLTYQLQLEAVDNRLIEMEALVSSGVNVFVVQPSSPSSDPLVSTVLCDSMNGLPQVVAAGGLTELGFLTFRHAPGVPVYTVASTGRLARVLDPTWIGGADALMSLRVALQSGVSDGAEVNDSPLNGPVSWFAPTRHPKGQILAAVKSHSAQVDQCWFEVRPGTTVSALREAQTRFSGNQRLVIAPLLPDDQLRRDPAAAFQEWTKERLPIAIGAAVFLLFVGRSLLERPTMTVYRLSRAAVWQVVIILSGEAIVVLVFALFFANLVGAATSSGVHAVAREDALLATLVVVTMGIAGATGGYVFGSTRNLSREIKDR